MLKIKNLSVKIDKKQILKGVCLTLRPGEVQVLMGPNGSGKTTLAQALAGRNKLQATSYKLQANDTKILIDGENLLKMSVDERAKSGLFVSFQNPVNISGVKVFDFFSAEQNSLLKEKASLLEFRKKIVKKAKKLGLSEKILDRDLGNFSGGEKKRLELLQALVLKPKYAIFDEIDSGIDIDGLKTIEKIVKGLQKKGTGILLITHQPKILQFIKPAKIHVLIGGRIVKSGNDEILKRLERLGYKSFYCAACLCKQAACPKHT